MTPAEHHTVVLLCPADLPALLDGLTSRLGWAEKIRFQVELALEELVVNTFTHGKTAHHGPHNPIVVRLTVQQTGLQMTITVTDNGSAFDPRVFSQPDLTSCAEDRCVGGLGLFLTSKVMDEVHYQRLGEYNRVVLHKRTA